MCLCYQMDFQIIFLKCSKLFIITSFTEKKGKKYFFYDCTYFNIFVVLIFYLEYILFDDLYNMIVVMQESSKIFI